MHKRNDWFHRAWAVTVTGLRENALLVAVALACSALMFALLYDVFDSALRRWTDRDLRNRARLIVAGVKPNAGTLPDLVSHLDRMALGHEVGLVACGVKGELLARAGLGATEGCRSPLLQDALASGSARGRIQGTSVMATAHRSPDGSTVYVVQDRAFLDLRRKHVLQVAFVGAQLAMVALLILGRAGARIGSRRTEELLRGAIRSMSKGNGKGSAVPADLRLLVRDVEDTVARLAQHDARSGVDKLRDAVASAVPGGGLVVVANREPYSHERAGDGQVHVIRPASGLVTGIEPVLRACGGTWIAYGSGSADREYADRAGRLAVPPEAPEYELRRLFFDEEEYERYYSGFANEGLWPLCHLAHVQPMFRAADWQSYHAVNQSFARAAVDEATSDGLLLIQDYHFALVPRMVRELAPHVVTSIFWHIPWPNSEVVAICPWKERLLEGMLGADIVGFHTRQYCINFLETVQRYLECRVDFDEMSVTHGGHRTLVRPYPISVEWPYPAAPRVRGAALRDALGILRDAHVMVGVDRADYTKGLLERIAGVERLLEENPSIAERYVFVQLASPTRTRIVRYQHLAAEVEAAVERVNARFGVSGWTPIVLQMRTFSPDEVRDYYAMADSALVTPLHDGMNLVAKEYVSACEDGDGVLVLSTFAGAAKELESALIVNPYDAEAVAQAILRAIRMPLAERRARMDEMRSTIAAQTIYDWSESLVRDMAEVRQQAARFWPRKPGRNPAAAAKRVVAG